MHQDKMNLVQTGQYFLLHFAETIFKRTSLLCFHWIPKNVCLLPEAEHHKDSWSIPPVTLWFSFIWSESRNVIYPSSNNLFLDPWWRNHYKTKNNILKGSCKQKTKTLPAIVLRILCIRCRHIWNPLLTDHWSVTLHYHQSEINSLSSLMWKWGPVKAVRLMWWKMSI